MAKSQICKDHTGREFKSQAEMCRYWNVEQSTFLFRLDKGMSLAEALTKESIRNKTYEGPDGRQFESLTAMCNAYGISIDTYKERLNRGFTVSEALKEPLLRSFDRWECEDHTGRKFSSISTMCSFYGISRCTYSQRLRLGWSQEKALITPVKHSKIKDRKERK